MGLHTRKPSHCRPRSSRASGRRGTQRRPCPPLAAAYPNLRRQKGDTNEAALKLEQNLYKQTTESAKWLEDREDYYKALTESRYLQQRFTLVDTLVQWWADALRQQQGGAHPDLPDYTAETAEIAARFSTPDILRRITHLDELRENFNRNVLEALAVEVAFLRAFSAPYCS